MHHLSGNTATPARRVFYALLALLALVLGCAPWLAHSRDLPEEARARALLEGQSADGVRSSAGGTGAAQQRIGLPELLRSQGINSCRQVQPDLLRCSTPLRLNDLRNLSIEGGGMLLEFSGIRPNSGGVVLNRARNVMLSGLRVRWAGGGVNDPTPPDGQRVQTLGQVLACANGQKGGMLKLDWPLDGDYPLGAISTWDEQTGWPWRPSERVAADIYMPARSSASFSKGQSGCLPALANRAGERVLVRHAIYSNHAIRCMNCAGVTIENVTVHSAPGMAFVFGDGGRDLALLRNTVAPACAPKCARPEPSVTADGGHFAAVEGPIRIIGNDFSWQGDDSINVTGLMAPTHIQTPASKGWAQVQDNMRARLDLFEPGDPVLLFDGGMNALGEAKVLALEAGSGRIQLSRLPAQMGEEELLLLVPAQLVPHDVRVLDNYFHDHRARGILMGGSDALIENNRIERVTMAAILLTVNARAGFEGPGAQRVMIRKNRIADVNRYAAKQIAPSAISAGIRVMEAYEARIGTPIRDISTENNQFTNLRSAPDQPVNFGPGSAGRAK